MSLEEERRCKEELQVRFKNDLMSSRFTCEMSACGWPEWDIWWRPCPSPSPHLFSVVKKKKKNVYNTALSVNAAVEDLRRRRWTSRTTTKSRRRWRVDFCPWRSFDVLGLSAPPRSVFNSSPLECPYIYIRVYCSSYIYIYIYDCVYI